MVSLFGVRVCFSDGHIHTDGIRMAAAAGALIADLKNVQVSVRSSVFVRGRNNVRRPLLSLSFSANITHKVHPTAFVRTLAIDATTGRERDEAARYRFLHIRSTRHRSIDLFSKMIDTSIDRSVVVRRRDVAPSDEGRRTLCAEVPFRLDSFRLVRSFRFDSIRSFVAIRLVLSEKKYSCARPFDRTCFVSMFRSCEASVACCWYAFALSSELSNRKYFAKLFLIACPIIVALGRDRQSIRRRARYAQAHRRSHERSHRYAAIVVCCAKRFVCFSFVSLV
jgi:hypothetical protein